jgi:hypothetical protein
MNPYALAVYKCPFTKIRLGKDNDGGYVIANVPDARYTLLLSGGIESEITFEEAFIEKYPDATCLAFDGTIYKMPATETPNITLVKKNIGPENSETITNLHEIINTNDGIFIKMDIEGSEIPWIKSLNDTQLNKFEQIVMEFHNPFLDSDAEVFDKLNSTHYLIHFHGNNCCGLNFHKGVNIPFVFECTYLHKKFFTEVPELNTDLIPSSLDMKNIDADEIHIDYPPFVNALFYR